MRVLINELSGQALDWAICFALLFKRIGDEEKARAMAAVAVYGRAQKYGNEDALVSDMRLISALVRNECIVPLLHMDGVYAGQWRCLMIVDDKDGSPDPLIVIAPTLNLAVARCFVHSLLGDRLEVPDEFLDMPTLDGVRHLFPRPGWTQ